MGMEWVFLGLAILLVFANGFGGLTEQAFLTDFANGVPTKDARVLYAVQGRIAQTLFAGRTTTAAWRTKPSRYLVTTAVVVRLMLDTPASPDA